jgi:hypothetical protein
MCIKKKKWAYKLGIKLICNIMIAEMKVIQSKQILSIIQKKKVNLLQINFIVKIKIY